MSKLNVDENEIKNITQISVSEVSGSFSEEWLSGSFMDNVVKEINSLISSFGEAKSKAEEYLSTNDKISNQQEPIVPSSGGGGTGGSSSDGNSGSSLAATQLGENTQGGTSSFIKYLLKDSKVTILEVDDGSGWTKVKLEDGTEGYVETKYIQVTDGSMNAIINNMTSLFSVKPQMNYTAFNTNITAQENTNSLANTKIS